MLNINDFFAMNLDEETNTDHSDGASNTLTVDYNGKNISFGGYGIYFYDEYNLVAKPFFDIIDQYLFSGEDKWKTQNGLVMLLPHGYEGQGAEHSSARMERYLQLCAKDNVYVANCSTPANMFHILRRQMKADFRKPLVIFTPKSLLRHPKVLSSVDEFTKGSFMPLIDDNSVLDLNKINTVVFVTGKFYYDLLDQKERLGRDDVALVRIEQLFPLPINLIKSIISKYSLAPNSIIIFTSPLESIDDSISSEILAKIANSSLKLSLLSPMAYIFFQ